MVVQHNLTAMNANRYLGINNSKLSKSLEKLSSGYAINRAGDNAAGLAVSEKMRSQIAGLTQGVKNAQDGISMVQTYEGALTETDSILQRMKTLADQSANGTYQDDVDRDAIQLEFDQLNDELNQIADTDFNGVVCLNGGQMADGTMAVNGKFDYENGTAVAPSKLGKGDVNLLDNQGFNNKFTDATTGKNLAYADTFWNTVNSQWDRNDTDASNDGPASVDVTFQYDKASGDWKAISATNGADYKKVAMAQKGNGGFTVNSPKTTQTTYEYTDANGDTQVSDKAHFDALKADAQAYWIEKATGNIVDKTAYLADIGADATHAANYQAMVVNEVKTDVDGAVLADVVVDESKLANGDTITLTFNNPAGEISAPQNAGAKVTEDGNLTELIGAEKAVDLDLGVKLDAGFTKDKMNADVYAFLKELDGADVKVSYKENGDADYSAAMSITLNNGTIIKSGGDGDTTELSINGSTFTFTWEATDPTDATKPGVMTISADGQDLMTISAAAMKGVETVPDPADPTTTETHYSTGDISYKIGLENYKYDNGSVPSVEVAKTGTVSKSNSNKAATAPLTYTDHVVLQAGARTKDSVDFTFEYSSGGLGDLKANMNCSAREDGLGTAGLSLRTQEDANYAIDRIDNAINKVSMVRATFGAVQNRLEHKIDNMNVTIENITSAESGIRDTNMPQEMMNFTKQQILAQASQSMLAQANQLPQSVLSLLQ